MRAILIDFVSALRRLWRGPEPALAERGAAPTIGDAQACRKDAPGRRKHGAGGGFPAENCRKLSKTPPPIGARLAPDVAAIILIWLSCLTTTDAGVAAADVENSEPVAILQLT